MKSSTAAKSSKKKAFAKQKTAPKVWCDLSSTEARRLILKVGLGRDIGDQDMPTASKPNKLCQTLSDLLDCSCMRGWTVTKFISAGASGHVFRVVHKNGTKAAAKVQIGDTRRLQKELKAQRAFQRKGLAPKIIRYCSFKPKPRLSLREHDRLNDLLPGRSVPFQTEDESPTGNLVHIIIMEEIDGVLGSWLRRDKSEKQLKETADQIVALMKAFQKHKLTHGDFHLNNIGFVYTNASKTKMKLMPIDFGRSHVGAAYTGIEIGSLMRTLDSKFRGPVPGENRICFIKYIRAITVEEINYRVGSLELIAFNFKKYFGKYMRAHIT